MSIDLKAHGLRVKPLEWREQGAGCYAAYIGKQNLGVVEYVPSIDEWRVNNGKPSDFYAHSADAKAAFKNNLESHILALLEQVEGGQ